MIISRESGRHRLGSQRTASIHPPLHQPGVPLEVPEVCRESVYSSSFFCFPFCYHRFVRPWFDLTQKYWLRLWTLNPPFHFIFCSKYLKY